MKNSKQSNVAATTIFRRKVWSREVRWALIPDAPKSKSLASRVVKEISYRLASLKSNKIQQVNKIEAADQNKGRSVLSTNVSVASWHGWWKGNQHIDPRKLVFIEVLFPGSKDWFHYNLPLLKKESLKTYLFALDNYSIVGDRQIESFLGLNWIVQKWGPICKHSGDASFINKPEWFLALYDTKIPIGLYEQFNVLEPSSIIGFMLHLALLDNLLEDEALLLQWVFDLVSASLFTEKLINQNNNPMNINTGKSGMNAGAIIKIYISKIFEQHAVMRDAKMLDPDIDKAFFVSRIVESLNEANGLNLDAAQEKKLAQKLYTGFQLYMNKLLDYDINEQDLLDLYKNDTKPLLVDLEKI